MSTVFEQTIVRGTGNAWLRWLPVALGLAALYVPTYIDLAQGAWNDEQNAHGPLVLLIIGWLVWQKRAALASLPERGSVYTGAVVLAAGLLLYWVGRTVEFVYFETFSQIPVVIGMLLALYGPPAVRVLWFPLLYLIFLVPLPGIVVDAATGPLKHAVSVIAEDFLYQVGYPIARNGVVLIIGQYQLLVADACSGLNSMYSLSAMGLLFLYITRDGNWLRTALLLLSIWPIAFMANIVRVLTLVLVTYHLGDEAGQGFLHGLSGILLFMISLLLLFGLHALLNWLLPQDWGRRGA
jgi:exosortase B